MHVIYLNSSPVIASFIFSCTQYEPTITHWPPVASLSLLPWHKCGCPNVLSPVTCWHWWQLWSGFSFPFLPTSRSQLAHTTLLMLGESGTGPLFYDITPHPYTCTARPTGPWIVFMYVVIQWSQLTLNTHSSCSGHRH